MDIRQTLDDFKREIDAEMLRYFDSIIEDVKTKDAFVADALEYVKKFSLSGGKRLRAAFMYYGYLAAGGTEHEKMLRTALSIEMVHIFLLIHDDIMDRDEMRHGVDTAHTHYRKISQLLFPDGDHDHFGASIALIVGDMVGALGNQILFDAPFEPKVVLQALSKLQGIVALTVIGQTKDIYMEYDKKATKEEILRMYEYKTARYTVEGPLHLGGILGGADKDVLDIFSGYARPLGIAFQIQDDILGIFGSEEKLGKPVGSDIQEGKLTLLVAHAFEKATSDQKRELKVLLEKKEISRAQIKRFREIIEETGARDFAKRLAQGYIDEAKEAVIQSENILPEAKEFLLSVADYMTQREM